MQARLAARLGGVCDGYINVLTSKKSVLRARAKPALEVTLRVDVSVLLISGKCFIIFIYVRK